jgi:hypothetical protein
MLDPYVKRCPKKHSGIKFKTGFIKCDTCRIAGNEKSKFTHYWHMKKERYEPKGGEIHPNAKDVYDPVNEEYVV